MSPGAVKALTDFVRLMAEEPSGLYFEKLLKQGAAAWPEAACRHPALKHWPGIAGFKQLLTGFVGNPTDCQVLLANRSAQLMKLAAKALFNTSRRVLTTDLSWPAWQEILLREAAASGKTVITVPLREAILFDRMTSSDLITHVARHFSAENCDSLFLPAVDNLGVRIPVHEIVQSPEIHRSLRFTVVDGAQALGHVPISFFSDSCDLLIAGCHKWIRAYQPLGLAFYARAESRTVVDRTLSGMMGTHEIDDPLLCFVKQMESGCSDGYSETANISPLFSCFGSLQEVSSIRRSMNDRMAVRSKNVGAIVDATAGTGWLPLQVHQNFRSGVVLLRCINNSVREAPAELVRSALRSRGLTVSAYSNGLLRLSMPDKHLNRKSIDLIRRSLLNVS